MPSSFMYKVLEVIKQPSKLLEYKMKEWKEIVFQYTISKHSNNMNKASKNMNNKTIR